MIRIEGERRDDPRTELLQPCKVYEPISRKYHVGSTSNVSRSGMLIQIERPMRMEPGDELYLGLAAKRRSRIICHSDMMRATVVRASRILGDRTTVAVRLHDSMDVRVESARAYPAAA